MTKTAAALPFDVLSRHRVFGLLPEAARASLASQCSWTCVAAGAEVLAPGQWPDQLALIASGAVSLQDPDLGWAVALQAGECFGAGVTPAHQQAAWQAVAVTDTALALLPADALKAL